ncbi:MAG: glycosyl transferase, group 1 [Gemmatimonadetes bacterium]|nr:glycosyl transferase, group 1 [Gemmatimonadota bacterium]
MRIGLNLLPVHPGIGGAWNYLQALIPALAEHDSTNEYVLFVTSQSAELVPPQNNFRSITLSLPPTQRAVRVLYENTLFRRIVQRAQLDCLHHVFGTLPFAGDVPSAVTIFDLMELDRPDEIAFFKRNYLNVMRRRASIHADVLMPMSNSTAEHLHRRLHVPWERMIVVPASMERRFAPQPAHAVEQFRERLGLPPAFWLAVADHYPHKNYERLIIAVAQLEKDRPQRWPLAIRAEPSREVSALIEKHGLERRVTFVPRLLAREMPLLYGAASALVFPSLFEGGGLPVMEAMACGCPVVASSIPTTHEFAAEAAITFDPMDVDAIAAAMRRCEDDSDLRARQIEKGLDAVSTLRPATVAAACMKGYEMAVSRSARAG